MTDVIYFNSSPQCEHLFSMYHSTHSLSHGEYKTQLTAVSKGRAVTAPRMHR